MYDYALVQPGPAPADPRDAATLGVEITDAATAARCGLGVIDPQHTPGASASAQAACEAALEAPLPPPGARLVTMRPDVDAAIAMAVLTMRAEGCPPGPAALARLRRAAALDRFDRGPWPGPRPLPERVEDLLEEGPEADLAALSETVRDRDVPMKDRVAAARRWLETGEAPAAHAGAARSRAGALLRALNVGSTQLRAAAEGRIGVVLSLEPGALALAYRLAPVVVALHPAFTFPSGAVGRKYTLAAWDEGRADLDRAAARLTAREAGWGGQRRVKGSPQDRPSRLTLDQTVEAVTASLLDRVEEAGR